MGQRGEGRPHALSPARDAAMWAESASGQGAPGAAVTEHGAAPPGAGAGSVSILRAPAEATPPPAVPHSRRVAQRRLRRRGRSGQSLTWAVCAAAAVAGAAVEVAPSGDPVADRVLAAGFVALVAAAGSTAKRWTWFVAAGAGLALAGGLAAIVAGGVALVLAFASSGPVRPAAAVGAATGGLSAVALLLGDGFLFHGASALLVAAAVTPILVSGYRYAGRSARRVVRRGSVAVAVAVAALVGAYGALLVQSRRSIEHGIDRLEHAVAAARDGEDVVAEQRFGEAGEAFAAVDRSLGSWWAESAEVVPVLGHNARAIQAMSATASELAQQGERAAADADVDRLTVEGGRLDLERVRSLESPLVDVAATLEVAAARMGAVDTTWLATPVAEGVSRVRSEATDALPDARLAAEATRVVPTIFGGDGETRWFVAFVTPVEARGRSGFIGNYAELTAVDGDVEMTRFGRVGELEAGGTPGPQRTLSGPDDYLARWSRYSPASVWRNVTMSPDFPSIGHVVTELYPQSGGQPVDGVIAIDPTALAGLLEFTGPVEVPGVVEPLTSENAADFMFADQYVALPDTGQRVDVLETLARTTFDRLTSGDLPSPRTVADTLGPAVRDGHIQLYSADPAQQDLFRRLDADGALPPVAGDSLAVVNSNASGNKIDRFLSRDIDYRAEWDPSTGDVDAAVTVTLVNDAPRSGLPDYVIGNALDDEGAHLPAGTNRTHLSIYTPFALDGAEVDGRPAEIAPEVERDRYAYSLFLDVAPEGGTRTVTLRLRGAIPAGGGYRLDVAAQPLVTPDRLDLTVRSVAGGVVRSTEPMGVEGATATASVRLTEHETTFEVMTDE